MADAGALGDDHTTFIKAEGMPALSRAAFQMHGFAGINSIQDGRPGFYYETETGRNRGRSGVVVDQRVLSSLIRRISQLDRGSSPSWWSR